ncbi:radical SAM protein [Candidatus Solincola tengchongensis]|uniref:B12-binding domain-containing radical SAM protein n=1 Tax=Candidatus Solincola tengchongensis TaxID=2900693 RepID=UPI00257EF777|nr:radical SAM protein [Candidatus Solincola tengchongensis]
MRVLLISENRCRENLVPFPLGIACVASASRNAGHEVSALDLMFSSDPVKETVERVREFRPHCIGLSIRNIDNQDMFNSEFYLPPLRELVRALRAETDAPIVLGGAGFSIFPLQCLEYLDLEVGVVGEGERTFLELLRRLENNANFDSLPGLAIRREGRSWVNPPAHYAWPGSFPPPDRELFDVRRYNSLPGGTPAYTANLQARRGCHMRCIYCTNPVIEGKAVRARPPSEVAEELAGLEADHGIRYVIFTDSLFNYPQGYTLDLCREIASRELSLRWWCTFNPLFCEPSVLEALREAGCVGLSIGNESGSEEILSALRKDFTRRHVVRSVSLAKELGLRTNCFLLLGGPGENERTLRESLDLMLELAPDQVTVTVGIRVYPGCELETLALKRRAIEPGQNLLYPTFYLEPEVSSWIYPFMREFCAGHPGWVL